MLVIIIFFYAFDFLQNNDRNRMTLCNCVFMLADRLLPTQLVTQAIKSIIDDGRSNTLAEIKAVLEYWLWGPSDTTITGNRTTSLQRLVSHYWHYMLKLKHCSLI